MHVRPKLRFNRKRETDSIFIEMGTNKFYPSEKVYYNERKGFGVTIVGAVTRYGKSVITSNLATGIGQHRPVIFIDYLGEHRDRKFPNFLSQDNNGKCLPLLKEIKGFKLKISQHKHASDWLALSYSDRGAQLMEAIAHQVNAHRDDPKLLMEILNDCPLPNQPYLMEKFIEKWGFEMQPQFQMVIDSCKTVTSWLIAEKYFGESEDFKYDFGELALKYKYLDINFNLHQADTSKARAMAGIVLKQIVRVLQKFKVPPLIVVEEADVLAPNQYGDGETISSLKVLIQMVLKLQKFQFEIIFIVQDLKQLHSSIVGNYHAMILGQMPSDNPFSAYTQKLVWDIDMNYREFVYLRKGTKQTFVFIPDDSCTIY